MATPRPLTVRLLADAFGLAGAARDRFCQAAVAEVAGEASGSERPVPPGPGPATGGGAAWPVPAQLPADVPGFAGRASHLKQLDALVDPAGRDAVQRRRPTTVTISAVSGMAGVGKTALAVHWAHTVAKNFPDGQLYVNLRGFDPSGRVMDGDEAMRGFLGALGVAPEHIPHDAVAQVGLFRSLIAGRRMLMVLDNARDADHVRQLLPPNGSTVAVVTSRRQLTGLVAAHGARPLLLDVLTDGEARVLLTSRLGAERLRAEPDAVQTIITFCAGLPLALAIIAALVEQTRFPLSALVADLARTARRLDVLDAGDPVAQVRAVFSWSYAALRPAARRLFRLLSLHVGPDISTAAAVSLAGLATASTRRLLGELVRANLLTEHTYGRYLFHDLLRVYAAELADTRNTTDARHAATVRLLDHYTHTAYDADRCLDPHRDAMAVPLAPPAVGVRPESVVDRREASIWFDAEGPVLLAAVRHAVETGYDTHAWQLTWALNTFLYRQGRWHDRVAAWKVALEAVDRLDDSTAAASAHHHIANAHCQSGTYDEVEFHLERALELYTRIADRFGELQVQLVFVCALGRRGHYARSLAHAQKLLMLSKAIDERHQPARILNWVGWAYAKNGDFTHALTLGEQAYAMLQRPSDNPVDRAANIANLGDIYRHLGRHTEAIEYLRHALALFHDLGDLYNEAEVCQAPGLMESWLAGFQWCGDRLGHRV